MQKTRPWSFELIFSHDANYLNHIMYNLKRFKESFIVAFLVFLKKKGYTRKATKSDKNYIKSRNATVEI